ncbi:MAG TPA: hypothetical protein H9970_08945, partial [Candidatus Merdibacter merdipullorum]|nr:hypothetical protein [Candidatus Merdibacter merdipullorum]
NKGIWFTCTDSLPFVENIFMKKSRKISEGMLTIFILGRILKSITKAKNGIRNGYPLAQRAAVWCEAAQASVSARPGAMT